MREETSSKAVSGFLRTGLGRLSAIVLGFLGLLVAARRLPAESLGAFVLLQVTVTFLVEFTSAGIHQAIPRFMARSDWRLSDAAIPLLFFRLLTVGAAGLLVVVFRAPLAGLFGSERYAELVWLVPCMMVLGATNALLRSVLEGRLRFGVLGLVGVVRSTTNFVAIVVLLLVAGLGVTGLIWAYILAEGAALLVGIAGTEFTPRWSGRIAALREMLRFGAPIQINYLLLFVSDRLDTLVIAVVLGPGAVAAYEIARKFPDAIEALFEAYSQAYLPLTARLYFSEGPSHLSRFLCGSLRWITFVAGTAAVGVCVAASDLVTLLFSEEYVSSIVPLYWLMAALPWVLVQHILGYSLMATGSTKRLPVVNALHAALCLVGYLVLVPRFGIAGAGFTVMFGTAILNPIAVGLVRSAGVEVRAASYLKPIAIMSLIVFVSLTFGFVGLLAGILATVAYLSIAAASSLVSVTEAWDQVRRALDSHR